MQGRISLTMRRPDDEHNQTDFVKNDIDNELNPNVIAYNNRMDYIHDFNAYKTQRKAVLQMIPFNECPQNTTISV